MNSKIRENQEIEGQEFHNQDYSKASFQGNTFSNCCFENCQFIESIWSKAQFRSCVFKNCNISMVKMDLCRLHDVKFSECKIVGGNFHKCEKRFFSFEAEKSVLISCNFSDLAMKRFSFRDCKLHECYFLRSVLTDADFQMTDLLGTTFHECNLAKADFRNALNYSIDPKNNDIRKARFSLPEAASLLSHFDIVLE